MYKKLCMKMLAIRIEWHWYLIMRCRKKGKILFEKGPPYTSDEILRLSKRLDRQCNSIWQLESIYTSLAKINSVCNDEYKEKTLCKQI